MCNGKSVCNIALGHNFLRTIIFTWYWVQLFCRQWIHLIEFEGSKMSCILFCISIQMLECSIVQLFNSARCNCSADNGVSGKSVPLITLGLGRHCLLFFFAAFCLLYFHMLRPRWGWGGWSIIWFKEIQEVVRFLKETLPKKKIECDVNLIQIRPITSKEFILRFTDENFLINLSRLKIGPTARGEIESFCPTRDWGENHSNLKSTVLTWVREALGRSNPITAHGIF